MPGGSTADVGSIYVTSLETPTPGTYWFLAEPVGGRKIQALGNVVVRKRSAAPSIGDRALATRSPTLASTNGNLTALTTSRRPDRALYERSIAQALAAKEPFVVTFATPQFCQTRTCGPGVDVVTAVRKKPGSAGVRFIHVEIYAGQRPRQGCQPLGRGVEAPDRAVHVRRRSAGCDPHEARGRVLGARARACGRRGSIAAAAGSARDETTVTCTSEVTLL